MGLRAVKSGEPFPAPTYREFSQPGNGESKGKEKEHEQWKLLFGV